MFEIYIIMHACCGVLPGHFVFIPETHHVTSALYVTIANCTLSCKASRTLPVCLYGNKMSQILQRGRGPCFAYRLTIISVQWDKLRLFYNVAISAFGSNRIILISRKKTRRTRIYFLFDHV